MSPARAPRKAFGQRRAAWGVGNQQGTAPGSTASARKRGRYGGLTADEIYDLAQQAQNHEWRFIMMPTYWTAFAFPAALRWQTLRFTMRTRARPPAVPGVYAFLVKPHIAGRLDASYLMYVGETDSLRRRFGEYQREARGSNSRSKLYRMFRMFRDHLHFSYAPVAAASRVACEDALMRALWPPANHRLPAELQAARSAFGS